MHTPHGQLSLMRYIVRESILLDGYLINEPKFNFKKIFTIETLCLA